MLKKMCYKIGETVFPFRISRPMVKYISQNDYGNRLIGCEIGTGKGKHIKSMLYSLDIEKMYAIDLDFSRFKLNDKEIKRIELDSLKASELIKDEYLDFCYLDADHHSVYNHILAWHPKVKHGGILGGHDFGICEQITRDVLCFVDEYGYDLNCSKNDWWIIKN